jgi:hypothetical protein
LSIYNSNVIYPRTAFHRGAVSQKLCSFSRDFGGR